MSVVAEVSIRELRNKGGEVIDRVAAGEVVTVTRDGKPVAELRPIARRGTNTAALQEAMRHLPRMDFQRLRDDIDAIVDPYL